MSIQARSAFTQTFKCLVRKLFCAAGSCCAFRHSAAISSG
jgi:hypothetical protein